MSDQLSTSSSRKSVIPNFLYRVAHLTWIRVNESTQTKLYVILTIISTIVCIILESLIAVVNSQAATAVRSSDIAAGGAPDLNSAFGHGDTSIDPYIYILVSLQRLKDENVFFILFHLFQLYFGIDAIVRQSVIQLIAHTVNEFLSVVFALIQLGETLNWRNKVSSVDDQTHLLTNKDDFWLALRLEISLASIMAALTCIFAHLSRRLLLQFGWNTYKRLGADIKLQARFRIAQVFLLILKLDAFFHLVFSLFWFVVMTQEGYYERDSAALSWYILHLLLTLIQIPALFMARHCILKEQPGVMIGFLVIHGLIIVDFIIVLQQSANSWVFWVLAVCLAILLSLGTMILGTMVVRNFDKGLKPHIQRLFDENYQEKFKTNKNENSWVIDDDDDDMPPTK
ncbi:uncharacterized protein BX664DRAFT_342687 [Halteromyces radiatus]|uniref:uncharacterized protein n=1 Tax=Halteromyces radiatus TaxID=101107 RepID=UPI002220D30D|nr:uncharacterized protein BX664DRAFT_342687 [Halteromyces radiatus]KAI8078780.1 hypothetical protein BX664DRAFT_342687 [Halteromyces radiatus]